MTSARAYGESQDRALDRLARLELGHHRIIETQERVAARFDLLARLHAS